MNIFIRAQVVAGLKAIAQNGPAEVQAMVEDALVKGELSIMDFDEAQARIAKIDGALVIAEAFHGAAG